MSTSNLYIPGTQPNPETPAQGQDQGLDPMLESVISNVEAYARQRPWTFAMWALGIGFVLGWRLKPW